MEKFFLRLRMTKITDFTEITLAQYPTETLGSTSRTKQICAEEIRQKPSLFVDVY